MKNFEIYDIAAKKGHPRHIELYNHKDREIRRMVAKNCLNEIKSLMLDDNDWGVLVYLAKTGNDDHRLYIGKNNNFFDTTREGIIITCIQNFTNRDLVVQFAKDSSLRIRRAVFAKIPDKFLSAMLFDPDPSLRNDVFDRIKYLEY